MVRKNCNQSPKRQVSAPVATDTPLAAKLAITGLLCAHVGRGAAAVSTASASTAAAAAEAPLLMAVGL